MKTEHKITEVTLML